MSAELPTKIQLGLDELAVICEQMSPLIARTHEPDLPSMETAAACAMLHSFYTEIEKILKIVALDLDRKMPSFESWHRDLLTQMAASTENSRAVMPVAAKCSLFAGLEENLGFRLSGRVIVREGCGLPTPAFFAARL